MWKILQQNLRFPLSYLLTALLAVVALRFITGYALATPFVLVSGFFAYILVFGLIFVGEQYEEKHHGYVFLSTLPLRVGEIVAAKFLRVMAAEVLLAGLSLFLISISSGTAKQMAVARSWILLNGFLALVLGGVAFIGLFSTNYTTFLKISLVFLVFLQMIPMLLLNSGKMNDFIEGILAFLGSINWAVWIPAGLLLYAGLLVGAVRVKTLHRC
jgi:hypothetical protein